MIEHGTDKEVTCGQVHAIAHLVAATPAECIGENATHRNEAMADQLEQMVPGNVFEI